MLLSVYSALRNVRAACRIRVQCQSRVLPIILLTAALDFAAASGATAQTITIGPGTVTTIPPMITLGANTTTTVVGDTTIDTTGNIFYASGGSLATAPTLNIGNGTPGEISITTTPGTTMVPNGLSALVVSGGGEGQPFRNNSTATAINIDVTGSLAAPVALTSAGQGVIWLYGPNARLTVTGTTVPSTTVPGDVVFTGTGNPVPFGAAVGTNQEATVLAVQDGATANLRNVTLDLDGPPGVAFPTISKMALCVGGCGLTGNPGSNVGGNATLNDVVINVTPDRSNGIWVSRVGTTMVTGGSITIDGDDSQGVHADATGTPVLNGVPITMNGANSLGVFANTFAAGQLQGLTPTSTITINGGSILMTGPNSTGVMASGSDTGTTATGPAGTVATVLLNDNPTITTTEANSNGLVACDCTTGSGGGAITGIATVTTEGDTSIGAFAQDGGAITLNNGSTVTIKGDDSAGYFANNGTISAAGTTTLTSGLDSPGGILSNGGKLTINGGTVTTTGEGSFGFLFQPATEAPFLMTFSYPGTPGVSNTNPTGTNTLTITNAMVNSAADAFHVTNAAADISVSGSTVTGNNGVLLTTEMGGVTNLTDTGSTLTGAILTDFATSTARVSLTNDTWNMSGSSNMTTLTETGSTINFAPPAAGADVTQLSSYKTLTTNTFTGNGGEIYMNTFLGADASPSDRIVITALNGVPGVAMAPPTSPVSLFFTNTGGSGAATQANGILVVEADEKGGTTDPGMFVMGNSELRAGAFDYRLFRSGLNPDNVPNDWFLRSTFLGPSTVTPEVPPLPPITVPPEVAPPSVVEPEEPGSPNEVFPSTPPTAPLEPGVLYPIIGPELATYGVVQPLARELGLSILGTLDDRVGDTYEPDVVGPAVAPAPEGPAVELPTKKPATLPTKKPAPALAPRPLFAPSVWGRFFGQTIDNRYQGFTDPRASGNLGGFQGGIDLLRGSLIAGQFERMGLYGAYGNVNANVDGLVTNAESTGYVNTHTGSMSLNAWSGGAYWTHVGPGGWYLDAVLQGTSYSGSASTADARLNTDGWGFIASLEGGVPFSFPQLGPGFVLEPPGQILWQKVSFQHDYDGLGDVALGDTTGPSGRIGLRGKWTIVTADDEVWQPYVRANLWRDWGAEADTVYSGTDIVPLVSQITLLEVGGGVTGRINANVSVFANVDYEFAVGAANGEKQNGVRGAFGARYTW